METARVMGGALSPPQNGSSPGRGAHKRERGRSHAERRFPNEPTAAPEQPAAKKPAPAAAAAAAEQPAEEPAKAADKAPTASLRMAFSVRGFDEAGLNGTYEEQDLPVGAAASAGAEQAQ